ncbi:TPA: hypothetical protein HF030_004789 [Escherichia coli]|nr:hypothetical protein [Escherichia coli]
MAIKTRIKLFWRPAAVKKSLSRLLKMLNGRGRVIISSSKIQIRSILM